jgi:hypothetical protein
VSSPNLAGCIKQSTQSKLKLKNTAKFSQIWHKVNLANVDSPLFSDGILEDDNVVMQNEGSTQL